MFNFSNLTGPQKVVGAITLVFSVLSLLAMAATHFLIHPFSGFTLWTSANRGALAIEFAKLANEDQPDVNLKYHVFQGPGDNGQYSIANDLAG